MIYSFGPFELDVAKVEMREHGRPCPIEPQVYALLSYLIEHRERLVSREELFEKVWDGRIVTDSALSSRIKATRQLLGDDGRSQRFIKTVHGHGFRFVADVQVQRSTATESHPAGDMRAEASPDAARDSGDAATYRPSIAVLPFRALGGSHRESTIAEGLPHELITELARLRWLFVVARGSSFRLRDDDIDPRNVGDLLGVRYFWSGTGEISGKQLVITTELVDVRGGDVVWAERYSGLVADMHTMRGEMRASILSSLEIQIPLHEAASARLRATENLDAWSAYHLGLQHVYRFNQRDNSIAAELFGRAVSQDKGFARAHAGLSFVHFQSAFLRQGENYSADLALARRHAERGVEIDPLDPLVNFTMGRTFWLEGDLDRALSWLERSTSLCPNYAQGIYACAWTETMSGAADAAHEHLDLAMRLSPLDPLYYAMLSARGMAHIARSEYAEGALWADRGARSPGAHPLIAMIAAVAQSLAGNQHLAMKWADEVRERNPSLTRDDFFGAFPIQPAAMRARISSALESVGFS